MRTQQPFHFFSTHLPSLQKPDVEERNVRHESVNFTFSGWWESDFDDHIWVFLLVVLKCCFIIVIISRFLCILLLFFTSILFFVTIFVMLTATLRHFQGYTMLAMQAAFQIDSKDMQLTQCCLFICTTYSFCNMMQSLLLLVGVPELQQDFLS